MKTLSKLIAIILLFSFADSLLAQKKTPLQILGIKVLKEKTEKGKSNEYLIKVFDTRYYIYNKRNVYDKVNPNYTNGDFEYIPIAYLTEEDWAKLEQFTADLIGDYVFKMPKNEGFENIDIFVRSDMQGNIKDVTFGLPNAVSIPIEVIEQLEAYVKMNMKLHFKINHTNQNANYMYQSIGIQLEPIRKSRAMKGK